MFLMFVVSPTKNTILIHESKHLIDTSGEEWILFNINSGRSGPEEDLKQISLKRQFGKSYEIKLQKFDDRPRQ